MFSPAFTAVCDACGQTTMWFKANRVREGDVGRPVVDKGFKCARCEAFEERVLDTRGCIRVRAT